MLLDIDHFKNINDTYGHAAGDEAIKHCADLIRRTFRDQKLIARIGGEEFIVLLPGKDVEHAYLLADKLRMTLEARPLYFQGQSVKLTASFGISRGMVDPQSFAHLLEKADRCLYRAKTTGRNRIEVEDGTTTPSLSPAVLRPMPESRSRASA